MANDSIYVGIHSQDKSPTDKAFSLFDEICLQCSPSLSRRANQSVEESCFGRLLDQVSDPFARTALVRVRGSVVLNLAPFVVLNLS